MFTGLKLLGVAFASVCSSLGTNVNSFVDVGGIAYKNTDDYEDIVLTGADSTPIQLYVNDYYATNGTNTFFPTYSGQNYGYGCVGILNNYDWLTSYYLGFSATFTHTFFDSCFSRLVNNIMTDDDSIYIVDMFRYEYTNTTTFKINSYYRYYLFATNHSGAVSYEFFDNSYAVNDSTDMVDNWYIFGIPYATLNFWNNGNVNYQDYNAYTSTLFSALPSNFSTKSSPHTDLYIEKLGETLSDEINFFPYCTYTELDVGYNDFSFITNTDYWYRFRASYDTYSQGYQDGYDDGYYWGYQDGDEQGRETGNADGYYNGYTLGYQDGVNASNQYTFLNLFGAIADTPVLMIRSLFDFDFFGVNLLSVVLSMFTALILFYLLRKLL